MSLPKTPTFLPAVRVRHKTHYGHIHVSIAVNVAEEKELEIFAQIGKSGEQTHSDLEGMCRLASLFLRVGGTIEDVAKQLTGIGSNLSSTEEKVSVANSLGEALNKYIALKKAHGIKAVLLGDYPAPDIEVEVEPVVESAVEPVPEPEPKKENA